MDFFFKFIFFEQQVEKKLFYKQNVLLLTSWGEFHDTNETDDGTADFLPTTFYTCAICVALYNRCT